jgi:hypothetical protein
LLRNKFVAQQNKENIAPFFKRNRRMNTYPELVLGSVPRGKDYFGQEALIENIWSKIKNDNILLVAPRRFGKTGAMYRLLDDPRTPYKPLYMNVEHIMSAADFMIEIIARLLRDRHFERIVNTLWEETKEFGQFLRNLPSNIDIGGIKVELRENTDVSKEWISYGERVISLLSKDGPPLLLIIDEFAIMTDFIARRSREEVAQFLRWFRAARTAPDTQTRFVIGGSINLIPTLNSMELVDTVNDLYIERLKPWDDATAKEFVETIFISRQLQLEAEVRDTILDAVGTPIPYLISVLLTSILDRQRATNSQVTKEMVKSAFEEDLLGGATSAVFEHYRSRIDRYYPGPEGQAAKAILGVLSRSHTPVQRNTLYQIFLQTTNESPTTQTEEKFKQLMDKLDNDFYITSQDNTCAFFSRVLQLWWKTHYGFQEE